MKHSFKYYAVLAICALIPSAIVAYVAFFFGLNDFRLLVMCFSITLMVVIPIDKKIEATWRGTVPITRIMK